MSRPTRAGLALALLSAAACRAGDEPFTCRESTQCVLGGAQGICEATGHCSFPDPTCMGGRRYGEHAPDGLSRVCIKARSCGDGETSTGEECDDGNRVNDDGCTNGCVRCGPLDGDARLAGETNGTCYIRHDRALDWAAAGDACAATGGHRAALTQREHETVTPILTPSALWLGLSDREIEGAFAWVTSEPLVYRRWRTGQPEDRTDTQDCVAISPPGFEWSV